MLATLETHMSEKFGPPGDDPVNQARETVRQDCIRAAENDSGFFSLTVPTGPARLSPHSYSLSVTP
ncbi:MAG: hypothetical protein R3F31_13710 [Verrucomicrobiales bacterium]